MSRLFSTTPWGNLTPTGNSYRWYDQIYNFLVSDFLRVLSPKNYLKWLIFHGIIKKWKHSKTQTLRAGCNKAEPKNFALLQTPFPEARDGKNLISWRWSLPLPTNPVWWGSIHAILSYHSNRSTDKQTQTQTHKQTGPITIHCTAKLNAHCK